MKARNDRSTMMRIRVKRLALLPLLTQDFDFAESSASIGRYWAKALRVGRVVTWTTYPPARAGIMEVASK